MPEGTAAGRRCLVDRTSLKRIHASKDSSQIINNMHVTIGHGNFCFFELVGLFMTYTEVTIKYKIHCYEGSKITEILSRKNQQINDLSKN